MSFVYDESPVESFFVSTKNLPELEQSGGFRLQIAQAKYGWKTVDGQVCPEGFDFTAPENWGVIKSQWVRIKAVVKDAQGAKTHFVNFTFFLPSRHAQDLAYFLNLRTKDNKLYFPDASVVPHEFEGRAYVGYEYPMLAGKEIYALLQFKGRAVRGSVSENQFDLIGFTDANWRGAFECANPGAYNGQPRPEFAEFLRLVPKLNQAIPVQASPYGIASAQGVQPQGVAPAQAQAPVQGIAPVAQPQVIHQQPMAQGVAPQIQAQAQAQVQPQAQPRARKPRAVAGAQVQPQAQVQAQDAEQIPF